jgi:competence protein ComEA
MMKYALAGLAVVAAIGALVWRPPRADFGAVVRAGASGQPAPAAAPQFTLAPGPAAAEQPPKRRGVPGIVVYVAGDVVRPGVYTLPAGSRANAAVARAGGPKPDADLVAVNLAAPLEDGMEIAVAKIGEAGRGERRTASPRRRRAHVPRGHGRRRRDALPAVASPMLDLNSAGEGALETLPGVGPALAARIVEYREVNGPFTSVDELADVSGITAGLQEKIAAYLVVR